jgi:hypothetical protein
MCSFKWPEHWPWRTRMRRLIELLPIQQTLVPEILYSYMLYLCSSMVTGNHTTMGYSQQALSFDPHSSSVQVR